MRKYVLTVEPIPQEAGVHVMDLAVGELVEGLGDKKGEILLRMYDGVVSLSDPQHTWTGNPKLLVRRLKMGTEVKLTVTP